MTDRAHSRTRYDRRGNIVPASDWSQPVCDECHAPVGHSATLGMVHLDVAGYSIHPANDQSGHRPSLVRWYASNTDRHEDES